MYHRRPTVRCASNQERWTMSILCWDAQFCDVYSANLDKKKIEDRQNRFLDFQKENRMPYDVVIFEDFSIWKSRMALENCKT